MNLFGQKIRELRKAAGKPLRELASFLDIDPAILSKMERGKRKVSQKQVRRFAEYFNEKEEDLMALWLSDQLLYGIEDEEKALKTLQAAEAQMQYQIFQKTDRKALIRSIIKNLKKFEDIKKAWIYGSFSRGDDNPKSDVDIALETSVNFSYFDLAEVQYQLEKDMNRKVDVGFIDSFKEYIRNNINGDLELIYEKK